jgi:hypothetical protein
MRAILAANFEPQRVAKESQKQIAAVRGFAPMACASGIRSRDSAAMLQTVGRMVF